MQKKMVIETCYGPVSQHVIERAKYIRLLICDVDGVMSNGLTYISSCGIELKAFNTRDGYGIRCVMTSGIDVAIITGYCNKLLEKYCAKLGIKYLYQGQLNKISAFNILLNTLKLKVEQVAYIGDDLTDAPVIEKVGLSVAVADAHPILRLKVDYVTHISGGYGAVRELCDLLLIAQGKLRNTLR